MSTMLIPAQAASAEGYTETGDPFLFKRFRTWWTLAAICLMTDGNGFTSHQDKMYYHQRVAQRYTSDPVLLLLTIATWAICAGLIIGHIAPTLRTLLKQKPLLAVAVFAVVSTLWSEAPLLTLRKAALLCLTFTFAWFFATYYSLADQRRMLLAAGAIMATASLAWVVLLPSYGIATAGEVAGEWKGVYGQKNDLGIAMVALFSGLPFCRIPNLRRLLTIVFQALLPLLLIIQAHARESIILASLFVGVRILGPVIARSRKDQLPFFLYPIVSGIFGIVFGWSIILSALGESAQQSWSGRLHEWSAVVPYILRRFWFGWGYAGFWTGTGYSLNVMKSLHVTLLGSDSGYTDNMLSFGLVGMSILLIVVLVPLRDFLRLLRRRGVPLIGFWYAGFIILTWVEAVVGDTFPLPAIAPTFIFVVACCGLTQLTSSLAAGTQSPH